MSSLLALWYSALALTAIALLIVAALVLARLLLGWRKRAREAERKRLVPLLLGEADADLSSRLWLADKLIAGLMVDLIQLVRGEERHRFIARAAELGVPARLRHQLGSGAARHRQAAAEALGLFSDERSIESLYHALGDRNPDVRLTAALALAQAGRAPPLRELVRRLDVGRREKSLLVNSLFKEIARHGTEELEALVGDEGVPATARIAAVEALAEAGSYAAVPLIAEAAIAGARDGRELAQYLRALAELGHPAAAPAVEAALSSPSASARAAAAEAVGRIGLADLAPRMTALLADPSWRVRFRAGEALVRMGEDGVAVLREAAAAGAGAAAEAAALTLRERGLA